MMYQAVQNYDQHEVNVVHNYDAIVVFEKNGQLSWFC